MNIKFGGYYNVKASWKDGGKALTAEEQKAVLPKIGRYNESIFAFLPNGNPVAGLNDAQGNDYMGYYDLKGKADNVLPSSGRLDPGGIKDVLNFITDSITYVARIVKGPAHKKAVKAFNDTLAAKANANPALEIAVRKTDDLFGYAFEVVKKAETPAS